MDPLQKIQVYAQAALAVLGTLYILASAIGRYSPPTSKLGIFCRKFAADLRAAATEVQKLQAATAPTTPTTTPDGGAAGPTTPKLGDGDKPTDKPVA